MPADPDIVIKAGDTDPPVAGTFKDGLGKAVPVGVSDDVEFRMKRVDADAPAPLTGVAVVVDGPRGKVRYEWADGDTDVAGLYEADFLVTYALGGVKASFPNGSSIVIQIIDAPV